ncbi:chorismate mutase [Roseivirga sp. BDSF3-8]|uniref:chorismate mutase n=1 Tax=Roseivirga sp. BDSF3-8 TaxID=3241598 RepID=UPI003531C76B
MTENSSSMPKIADWWPKTSDKNAPWEANPWVVAGPCSAETEEQLRETATAVYHKGIRTIRAGVWKPRTRPDSFEGIGEEALVWLSDLKKDLDIRTATEVATPEHVELALKHGVDILWIGARSTVNPFTVQAIAEALRGVDKPVLVKNPINPDLTLWIGALERLIRCGATKLGAIHRGFSSFQKTRFRNVPMWKIPIELKRLWPELPLMADPSHIGGDRSMIADISQVALDLNYDGLMIETHRDPDHAWSDAKQQVTPDALQEILQGLKVRKPAAEDAGFTSLLEELREQIDHADQEILEAMARRMSLVQRIGEYKKTNNVAVLQIERWKEIFHSRQEWAEALHLNKDFVAEFYRMMHQESIRRQTNLMTDDETSGENTD